MSLKLGVDLSIFRLLAAAQGPLTSIELAKRTGAEELLISKRLLPPRPGLNLYSQR